MVWLTLAAVLVARWFHPPEQGHTWRQLFAEEPGGWDGRRFPRSSTRVRSAQNPVPADLWRLEIEIAPNDVALLRDYHWNRPARGTSGGEDRPEVSATIREGSQVYTNVAIHLKGSMGSFRPFDDKPAFTLHFNKYAKGQTFHGFSKISLNNSVQDSTYISEAFCRELCTAAGVPAPSAGHATALINGRDLGLFVVTEGWGKPFLRQHFKDVSGNLYEGAFASDISPNLAVNSGDQPKDHSDLNQLLRAIHDSDPSGKWTRLKQILDVDRYATLLALEVMTCHWDGYSLNRNNYRIFHDRTSDRLVFLPHGMDQMFGSRGRMSTISPILPPMQGAVSRAFLSTFEGRALFLNRVAALNTNLFVEEKLIARARELAQRIRPTLAAYGNDFASMHDAEVNDFCRRISERCRSVTEQLAGRPQETKFDASGRTHLSGWKTRTTRPEAQFQRTREGARTLLKIIANGGTSGSWRSSVTLDPGEYVFEGIAELSDVESSAGVRLRISGQQPDWIHPLAGTRTPLEYRFEVSDPMTTVELICELGGPSGKASFDESSLRLTRQ